MLSPWIGYWWKLLHFERDRMVEEITFSRNSQNVGWRSGIVPECSAQMGDLLEKGPLLDDLIWPDFTEKLLLRDQLSRSLNQVPQNLPTLRTQGNRLPVLEEGLILRIQPERAKEMGCLVLAHRQLSKPAQQRAHVSAV